LLTFTCIYLNKGSSKEETDQSAAVITFFNSLNNNNYQQACSFISDKAINRQQYIYRETNPQEKPEPLSRKDFCVADLDSIFNFTSEQINQVAVRDITISGDPEIIPEENQDFVLLPVTFTVSSDIYDFNKQLVIKKVTVPVKVPTNKEDSQWKIESIPSLFPKQLVNRQFKELYLKDAQKILSQSQFPIRLINAGNLSCPRKEKLSLNQKKVLNPEERADIKNVLFSNSSKANKVCLLVNFQKKAPEKFSIYLEAPEAKTLNKEADYKYSFYVRNNILLATRSEFGSSLTNEPILAQAMKNRSQLKIIFAVPDSTKAEPLQPIKAKEVTIIENDFWPSGY
jgi:hypothetical protein